VRQALLNWYPFRRNSQLLEIGAGCGALTGLFASQLKQVYVNELTVQRSDIVKRRYCDRQNIAIFAGNILDFQPDEMVDYVTLIGVLEYAGRYTKQTEHGFYEPYLALLRYVKKVLAPGGVLLLAIENKIGLKYIAGGKEDHEGMLFSSLESYPQYTGIRTFSKTELTVLLREAGFSDMQFYYPLPDYKLPQTIITDAFFQLPPTMAAASYAHIIDFSQERVPLFDEISFAQTLLQEKIFDKFTNSFLVEAR